MHGFMYWCVQYKLQKVFSYNLLFCKNSFNSQGNESHKKDNSSELYHSQCCGSVMFWYGSGSVALTNGSESGSGSGSCYFHPLPSRRAKKYFFLLIIFWRYIYIIFLRKRSLKTAGIKVLSLFCLMIEGSGSEPLTKTDPDPDPGGPKTFQSYGSRSLTLQKTYTVFSSFAMCFSLSFL